MLKFLSIQWNEWCNYYGNNTVCHEISLARLIYFHLSLCKCSLLVLFGRPNGGKYGLYHNVTPAWRAFVARHTGPARDWFTFEVIKYNLVLFWDSEIGGSDFFMEISLIVLGTEIIHFMEKISRGMCFNARIKISWTIIIIISVLTIYISFSSFFLFIEVHKNSF